MNVSIITGASTGIGMELTKILAECGHHLLLISRNKEALERLKAQIKQKNNQQIHIFPLDLTRPNTAMEVYNYCRENKYNVNYLINNAGFGESGFFHSSEWLKTEQMIQLNITALTQLTRIFVEDMVKNRSGKILNVSSTAAFQPGPLMAVYYASKAFVLNFSEALNNEVKDFGVSVTTVCPGPTATNFQSVAQIQDTVLVKGKKLMSAAEVAQAAWKGMEKNKALVIPGFKNTFLTVIQRIFPRSLAVQVVRKLNSSSEK